ncbi:acyl-CoA thioesterase [Aureimonas flava]|uniref:Acyl-CoA thioesterase n=1 Tax=Aureimonas flava TaxID=2320271 RepID=A0A3A1WI72_9HYPH|nr:thioesterase family protein [Aureimonas flava]RIY00284.1 acyl-CoA thioesterase [Aureimonas flava]
MSETPRPPRQSRADYRAFVPVTTRWSDNDMYGHMNNAAYYAFFDTAVTSWLLGTGLSARDSMFFVAETGCRYLSEVGYPDRVSVGLRVGHLGGSSIRYEIGVFRNDEDLAAAEGLFVHVHIDKASRRPSPVPAPLRDALEALRP